MTSNRCGARRPVAGRDVGAEVEPRFRRVAQEAADFEQLRRGHDDRPVADVEADLRDAAGNGGLQRGDERRNLGAGGRRRIGRARRRRRLRVVRGSGFAAAVAAGFAAAAAQQASQRRRRSQRRCGAADAPAPGESVRDTSPLSGSPGVSLAGLSPAALGSLGSSVIEFVARASPRPSRARLSSRRRRIPSPESPGRRSFQ